MRAAVEASGAADTAAVVTEAPPSNTGAENALGAQVGVGWAALTVWTQLDREAVIEALSELLGELLPMTIAPAFYTVGWHVGAGSRVAMHEARPGEVHIEVKQTDCEALGWRGLLRVLRWADAQTRWHATRFDLNYDDREVIATPAEVYQTAKAGDVVTHVTQKHISYIENLAEGATCYVGSPQGDERLRVYNGQVQHQTEYAYTRWEHQMRRERADQRMRQFFGIGDVPSMSRGEVVSAFWGVVRRFVDFRDSSSKVHAEDRSAVGWWSRLTSLPAVMKLAKLLVVPMTFERKARYVARYLAPTLALIVREVHKSGHGGWGYLESVVAEGEKRLCARERRAFELTVT